MTRIRVKIFVLALVAWSVGVNRAAAADLIFSPTFQPGWHLIGLPALPDPEDPYLIFGRIPIEYRLYGWDPVLRSYVTVDPMAPDMLPTVVSGEGYWLSVDSPSSTSYLGLPWEVGAVRPIPLGPAGWHLIGNPHTERVPLADCCVAGRGGTELTLADAVSAGWLVLPMYGWDIDLIAYSAVGLLGPPDEADDALSVWSGYWLNTLVDDVRLVAQRPPGDPFQAWLAGANGMEQEYTLDLSLETQLMVVAAAPIHASQVRAIISGLPELVTGNSVTLFRADNWPRQMPFGKSFGVENPGLGQYDYTITVEATTAGGTKTSVVMSLTVVGVEPPPA